MRQLFIVGAKLLGLLCLWWAISAATQIISYGGVIFSPSSNWASAVLFGLGLIAYFILAIWFAAILLIRTEWLADKVGVDKDSELGVWPGEKKLLNLGVMLLGFYVLVYAVPSFVQSSLTLFGMFLLTRPPGYRDATSFLVHYVIPVFGGV